MKIPVAKLTLVSLALIFSGPTLYSNGQGLPTGQLIGTVQDQATAVVPNASVKLEDEATGLTKTLTAGEDGGFAFLNLEAGLYRITVEREGFQTAIYNGVKVDGGRTSNLTVTLKVGEIQQKIEVIAGVEELDTTSNTISTTVRSDSIQKLPFNGRTILNFALLSAGAQVGGTERNSTFNGLPKAAMDISVDGINNNSQRFRSGDAGFFTFAAPRLGAIEEVTISSANLGADSAAEGALTIRFVTKRGTNDYRGSVFWTGRNDAFNANTWTNNVRGLPRAKVRQNEFGGNVGGPLWRSKRIYFFLNYEVFLNPSQAPLENTILTTEAQSGIFRYRGTDGVVRTANLLSIAGANGFPSTVDPTIAGMLQQINGSTSQGSVTTLDLFRNRLFWLEPRSNPTHYPTVRLDYEITDKLRWFGTWNLTDTSLEPNPGQGPTFPGFENFGNFKTTRYVAGTGFQWTITPTINNEFRMGLQGNRESFWIGSSPAVFENGKRILWPLGLQSPHALAGNAGGTIGLPILRNNPVFNLSDNLSIARGNHTFIVGGRLTRTTMYEAFADATVGGAGLPLYNFGVVAGDPVSTVLTAANLPGITTASLSDANALYALLTGRLSSINGGRNVDETTHQYNDFAPLLRRERLGEFGFYFQDSWRATRDLTLNYGIRWQFQGVVTNTNDIYTSPPYEHLFGVSGVGNLFAPGTLNGPATPIIEQRSKTYDRDWVNPAPNFGVAWNPEFKNRFAQFLFGEGRKSVFRGGYSLSYFREGMLNIQQTASISPGLTQSLSLFPGQPGFAPGGLLLRDPVPPLRVFPQSFSFPIAQNLFTFQGGSFGSVDPSLRAPYVQSWSVGVQREFGQDTVLELRYVGNRGSNLWRAYNINEVNIFENGFLEEFKKAQQNLAVNRGASVTSFANRGLPGQVALPIFEAAFGSLGGQPALSNAQGFGSGTFINLLDQGQAGSMANALASSALFLCRMVGNRLPACGNLNFNASGLFPSNFFQVNPDGANRNVQILTDNSFSNYNGFQVELRRRLAQGLLLNANYVFSKALTDRYADSTTSFSNFTTLRDRGLDRSPSSFDLRHVFNVYASYELPFGPGRKWSSQNPIVKRLIEGWRLSTIVRIQSGRIFKLTSGRFTVNGNDSGVILKGITISELQNMIFTRFEPGSRDAFFVSRDLIGPDGRANRSILDVPSTPGEFGSFIYLRGPRFVLPDLGLVKTFKISERVNVELWAEAFNVFNHQTFLVGGGAQAPTVNIDATDFGRTTSIRSGPRTMQFRFHLTF